MFETKAIVCISLIGPLGRVFPGILQSFGIATLHAHTYICMCCTVGKPKCSPYIALGASCYPGPEAIMN